MNLVGKILVVLVFVMSLVFMAMSFSVTVNHDNWREMVLTTREEAKQGKTLGMKYQLEDLQLKFNNLALAMQKVANELKHEGAMGQRIVTELDGELKDANDRVAVLQDGEEQALQSTREQVAAIKAMQEVVKKFREEVEKQRISAQEAQAEASAMAHRVDQLQDQSNQFVGNMDLLRRRNEALAGDVARFRLALDDRQIRDDRPGPPRVEGLITGVRDSGYVEVSIGMDDGLLNGHELDVYRLGPSTAESIYLGRVRVVEAQPDVAVAQIMPEYKKGIIQKEDRVATRLN